MTTNKTYNKKDLDIKLRWAQWKKPALNNRNQGT